MNFNCSDLSYKRNLQEQVKKAYCYQKLFWPFPVWINCSSDLKIFANSWLSASNFKSFSRSLEQFFLTVSQNNFGNKIPFLSISDFYYFFLNYSWTGDGFGKNHHLDLRTQKRRSQESCNGFSGVVVSLERQSFLHDFASIA